MIDPRKSKAEAAYQPAAKGARSRCDLCPSFVHPDACKAVKGTVTARGWCQLFGAMPTPSASAKTPASAGN